MRPGKGIRPGKGLTRKPMRQGGGAAGTARRVARAQRMAAHVAQHPHCEAGPQGCLRLVIPGPCWFAPGGGLDAQHVRARGMGGTRTDDSPLVSLCRGHHDYIERHPELARALGLRVGRA